MTTLPTDSIIIGKRYREDLGDIESLAKNIEEVGLLHPVVVTPDRRLVAGRRRLEAFQLKEWADIPVNVVDLDNIARGEYAENVYRKDFLPSEAVAIGRVLEERERGLAGDRMKHTGGTYGKLPEVERGETRNRVGGYIGMSGKTYEKAKEIVEAAEANPERFGDLPDIMDASSIHTASGIQAIETHRYYHAQGYQEGVEFPTAEGYLVPPFDIEKCVGLSFRDDVWETIAFRMDDSTSEKGKRAVKLIIAMIKEGLFPLLTALAAEEITDKELQVEGQDVIVLASAIHAQEDIIIQVKCDYIGGESDLGGSGNLFLQTAESNPLKRY